MSDRIGLYGGSFNPIHHGHLIVARAVAERLQLSRVILLPSGRPPHKLSLPLADARHRAAMVQLAIQAYALFEFSDFDLTRDGPSYTIETVLHFKRFFGASVELFWIIGADSLADLVTWRQVDRLVDACRVVSASRPGWQNTDWSLFQPVLSDEQVARLAADIVQTPQIDISSTAIRDRVRGGLSIRYFLPEPVREYIHQQGLYR